MPKNKGAEKAGTNSKSQGRRDVPFVNKAQAKQLDQYYTEPSIAALCWAEVVNYFGGDIVGWQFVEPSAGDGAFLRNMPTDTIAIDIDPKGAGIVAGDFLKVLLPIDRPLAIVGNPPFGKNANMATAFFRHAAKQGNVIALILPRTFCKASVQNRLDPAFHLVFEMKLPRNAFTFLGKEFNVPAVFQIWERREEPRAKIKVETRHPDFVFTTAEQADYALWRVGVKAGEIHHDFTMSKSSHYFIRVTNDAVDVEMVMSRLGFAFADAAGNTAGNPSLAKSEIVALYKAYMANPDVEVSLPPPKEAMAVEPGSDIVFYKFTGPNPRPRRRQVRASPSWWKRMPRLRVRRWRRLQRRG